MGDRLDDRVRSQFDVLHMIKRRPPLLHLLPYVAGDRNYDLPAERISRKVAGTVPYKNWREMERAAKGDRFGLSRQ